MNEQKPIRQELDSDGVFKPLSVNSIFYTIQGEGPFSGRPAVFVRLGGCNLQCTWCDTEYTDNTGMFTRQIMSRIETLIEGTTGVEKPLVVITGGEPFRQHISTLCRDLLDEGFQVQIETNGTLTNADFPWEWVTIVTSPKTKFLHPEILKATDYWKYVVSSDDEDSSNGLPLFSTQTSDNAGAPHGVNTTPDRVYLTPLDSCGESQNYENRRTAVDLCMKHGYNLNLQIHKLLNLQ